MDLKLIAEIVIAALAFAGLHEFAEHSGALIGVFPNEALALILIVAAIALYAMRRFLRFAFGLIEILLGVDALWNIPDTAPLVVDAATRTQFVMQSALGLYFIVRGLDNSEQSGALGRLRKARA